MGGTQLWKYGSATIRFLFCISRSLVPSSLFASAFRGNDFSWALATPLNSKIWDLPRDFFGGHCLGSFSFLLRLCLCPSHRPRRSSEIDIPYFYFPCTELCSCMAHVAIRLDSASGHRAHFPQYSGYVRFWAAIHWKGHSAHGVLGCPGMGAFPLLARSSGGYSRSNCGRAKP